MKIGLKNSQPLHSKNNVAFAGKDNNAQALPKMKMAQKAHKGKLDLHA